MYRRISGLGPRRGRLSPRTDGLSAIDSDLRQGSDPSLRNLDVLGCAWVDLGLAWRKLGHAAGGGGGR
eukprot:365703-Chlamydomonas_euryale.AAC.10